MRIALLSLSLFLSLNSCQQAVSDVGGELVPKINGIAFTAPPNPCTEKDFNEFASTGANWINLIPYAFCRPDNPEVQFDWEKQWWGEKKKGIIECINLARLNDLKIMVKPQLWISGGKFTGDIVWESEEDWATFESTYERYILDFAILSEENQVEMFCIGTELEEFVIHRPEFWNSLIEKVREVYSGKLVYAANWDEYPRVPFWSNLDYIGVDAYFPLSDEKTPSVEQLNAGWQDHKSGLRKFSADKNKPILFTEYGYRSVDFTALKPWESQTKFPLNLEAQVNCYRSIHSQFWDEDWFAGGFLWKWHSPSTGNTSGTAINYTPQGKPALDELKKAYSN